MIDKGEDAFAAGIVIGIGLTTLGIWLVGLFA